MIGWLPRMVMEEISGDETELSTDDFLCSLATA